MAVESGRIVICHGVDRTRMSEGYSLKESGSDMGGSDAACAQPSTTPKWKCRGGSLWRQSRVRTVSEACLGEGGDGTIVVAWVVIGRDSDSRRRLPTRERETWAPSKCRPGTGGPGGGITHSSSPSESTVEMLLSLC